MRVFRTILTAALLLALAILPIGSLAETLPGTAGSLHLQERLDFVKEVAHADGNVKNKGFPAKVAEIKGEEAASGLRTFLGAQDGYTIIIMAVDPVTGQLVIVDVVSLKDIGLTQRRWTDLAAWLNLIPGDIVYIASTDTHYMNMADSDTDFSDLQDYLDNILPGSTVVPESMPVYQKADGVNIPNASFFRDENGVDYFKLDDGTEREISQLWYVTVDPN